MAISFGAIPGGAGAQLEPLAQSDLLV